MADPPAPIIVLVGMMGAGKSSVGRALARQTGRPYHDNDELVHQATGRAPEAIDVADGEAALHAAEEAALRHALSLTTPVIVGAAAGVVADPASVDLLRAQAGVVYLRAQPRALRRRIGVGDGRRQDATDLAWLEARHAERDARYRALATLTIDTDDRSPDAIASEIRDAFGLEHGHPRP